MTFVAQELREIMAELGFETVEEMVGRTELLEQRSDVEHPKAKKLDLSVITEPPVGDDDRTKTVEQNHDVDEQLDWDLIDAAEPAIDNGEPVAIDAEINNVDRAVGATLSNRISRAHGKEGLPEDTVHVDFDGTAGQSFGAFVQSGVTMELTGTGNDYVGKGLSGGKLIVHTPEDAGYVASENILVGNVALYGATQGEMYVNGQAGERFAVRNSGVKGVVEGVGDHGCEYMTGGAIAVIGDTGKNFAAGMSGGVAYVYDPEDALEENANTGMASLYDTLDTKDRQMLRRLLENHAAYTDSEQATELLDDWESTVDDFVRVLPDAYAEIIEERPEDDVRTELPAPATPSVDDGSTDFQVSTDD